MASVIYMRVKLRSLQFQVPRRPSLLVARRLTSQLLSAPVTPPDGRSASLAMIRTLSERRTTLASQTVPTSSLQVSLLRTWRWTARLHLLLFLGRRRSPLLLTSLCNSDTLIKTLTEHLADHRS